MAKKNARIAALEALLAGDPAPFAPSVDDEILASEVADVLAEADSDVSDADSELPKGVHVNARGKPEVVSAITYVLYHHSAPLSPREIAEKMIDQRIAPTTPDKIVGYVSHILGQYEDDQFRKKNRGMWELTLKANRAFRREIGEQS